MKFSDINHIESVAGNNVEGGWYNRFYAEKDIVDINFSTTNLFQTAVVSPVAFGNSASAGAKGDAYTFKPAYTFTKADTLSVAYQYGDSFSASTSVSVITPIGY